LKENCKNLDPNLDRFMKTESNPRQFSVFLDLNLSQGQEASHDPQTESKIVRFLEAPIYSRNSSPCPLGSGINSTLNH